MEPANRNKEELKQLVNDVKVRHPAKGSPASSGWVAQLWTSMSPMEAERTARSRLASAVEAEARSNLGPSGLRTNSPRQSLERLCFSRRGIFLRKRCSPLPEIPLRLFIPLLLHTGF
ncbi:hypothetical protein ACOMHN_005769 [Nucella lapillus]